VRNHASSALLGIVAQLIPQITIEMIPSTMLC
jgi:hypothetical protein